MIKKISIVLPVYNECAGIEMMISSLVDVLNSLPFRYEIIMVDDGSSDGSHQKERDLSQQYPHLFYLHLSRNFGHQYAVKAGVDYSSGDCVISMDADLQHPPLLIPQLVAKWQEGYDIVFTKRIDNDKVPFFKRMTSKYFYHFADKISDIKLEEGTADFRLLDRRAADVISSMPENDLFLRGIVSWVGFKQYSISYEPNQRFAGHSKYTFKKMFSLALKGITSFSVKPLHFAAYLGLSISLLSLLFIPYVIYTLWVGHTVAGWLSLMITIAFFGGMNFFILGILGIYVGKIFIQVKQRPTYIIQETNIDR